MRFRPSDKSKWTLWFAWRPVKLNADLWVWREWVERRHVDVGHMDFRWEWQYRLPVQEPASRPCTKGSQNG